MRGTGAEKIGKGVVYAYFTLEGKAARLRLSADECEQFDLFVGQQVRIGLPGGGPGGRHLQGLAHPRDGLLVGLRGGSRRHRGVGLRQ